jgi:hypothetical protein
MNLVGRRCIFRSPNFDAQSARKPEEATFKHATFLLAIYTCPSNGDRLKSDTPIGRSGGVS